MSEGKGLVVQIENLNLNIGDKPVLRNFSLEIELGQKHAIIGRNGVGKTQLLRAVSGLSESEVKISGKLIKPSSVSFVFQKPSLVPWMTIEENLKLINRSKEAVFRLLQKFDLDKFASYFPYQISIGMQQKVNLIRAFLSDNRLILMDEPFVALDLPQKNRLIKMIDSLFLEKERSLLFVTHDIDEAISVSDRIHFLSKQDMQIKKTWEAKKTRDFSGESVTSLQETRMKSLAKEIYLEASLCLEKDYATHE